MFGKMFLPVFFCPALLCPGGGRTWWQAAGVSWQHPYPLTFGRVSTNSIRIFHGTHGSIDSAILLRPKRHADEGTASMEKNIEMWGWQNDPLGLWGSEVVWSLHQSAHEPRRGGCQGADLQKCLEDWDLDCKEVDDFYFHIVRLARLSTYFGSRQGQWLASCS